MGLIGHASDESPERKGVCEEIFTLQVNFARVDARPEL